MAVAAGDEEGGVVGGSCRRGGRNEAEATGMGYGAEEEWAGRQEEETGQKQLAGEHRRRHKQGRISSPTSIADTDAGGKARVRDGWEWSELGCGCG